MLLDPQALKIQRGRARRQTLNQGLRDALRFQGTLLEDVNPRSFAFFVRVARVEALSLATEAPAQAAQTSANHQSFMDSVGNPLGFRVFMTIPKILIVIINCLATCYDAIIVVIIIVISISTVIVSYPYYFYHFYCNYCGDFCGSVLKEKESFQVEAFLS